VTALSGPGRGIKIGSPRPPLAEGEPHPRLTQAHPARGGVTLGLEQGEPGANFCDVGKLCGSWQAM